MTHVTLRVSGVDMSRRSLPVLCACVSRPRSSGWAWDAILLRFSVCLAGYELNGLEWEPKTATSRLPQRPRSSLVDHTAVSSPENTQQGAGMDVQVKENCEAALQVPPRPFVGSMNIPRRFFAPSRSSLCRANCCTSSRLSLPETRNLDRRLPSAGMSVIVAFSLPFGRYLHFNADMYVISRGRGSTLTDWFSAGGVDHFVFPH